MKFFKALRKVGVNDDLFLVWRDHVASDDKRLPALSAMEGRAQEERQENGKDLEALYGEEVRYGMPLQLQHGA